MATARATPRMGVARPTMKVAMPSGKLWIAIEAAVDNLNFLVMWYNLQIRSSNYLCIACAAIL